MRSKQQSFRFTLGVLVYPLLFGLAIWYVFWIDREFGLRLYRHGIRPLQWEGLEGILFSPFLHGDVSHLYHNTLPLMILSAALLYFYRPIAWKVLGLGLLLTGLLTWLIGASGNHIGASGVIYLLASFIFFKGIFSKNSRLVALSMVVVFMYGGLVWYLFPVAEGISWEGHLSGGITGLLFALIFRKNLPAKVRYRWEEDDYNEAEDPFMQHFDEDGNFREELPGKPGEDNASTIRYMYRPSRKDLHQE